ncbi:MAG: RagB/SusD family nutrient uptake outer membrane protein [Bacteroidales bacterium]|nr:RagB/SusD family nutrient uptake outer membrane protein [Bacteroidales bacterium]
MKQYIILAATACLAIAATSCSEFLEEDMRSSFTPETIYASSLGFEVGSAGLYSIARSEYNTWGEEGAFIHNGACPYEALQVGTDLCDARNGGDGSLIPFSQLTLNSNTQFVKTYWQWAYNLIGSANELLLYAAENTNWDNATDQAVYSAEARFFRAYAYRYLVYLYGDVPWVETIQKPFVLSFTRTPKEEVISHIVEDLKYASENLPENPDAVKQGKLTRWAAYHYLSEMYLLQKDYANARNAAQAIIDSKYYELTTSHYGVNASGEVAGDAFSDMFLENNQNRDKGNKEAIWVMQFQYEYQKAGGGTPSDDWTRRAWNPMYFGISGFTLSAEYGGRGLAQILPMKWWIGTAGTNATGDYGNGIFDDGDMRNSEYNIKRTWLYNNEKEPSLYGKQCNITDATWTAGQLYPALTKFFYGKSDNLSMTGGYRDRMRIRLSETYFLLAEACLGLGDSQGAADAVNEVRRRAKVSNVSAADMDLDFLLDERIRELCGEEVRRFTLLRTGKLIERVKKYNSAQKDIITEQFLLWPIPQTIIDANRDVEFPQNPGY